LVTSLYTEKGQRYIIHVKATDGGGLISPNVATGNVSVENVNMKKPVVFVSGRVELLLPTSLGVLVDRVEGKDPDGDELETNITRGNGGEFFKIGKKSGEIRVGMVDGFTGAKHVLEVSVGDGRFWSGATIPVHAKQMERNPNFYFRNTTLPTASELLGRLILLAKIILLPTPTSINLILLCLSHSLLLSVVVTSE
jgi:hypothetical protein